MSFEEKTDEKCNDTNRDRKIFCLHKFIKIAWYVNDALKSQICYNEMIQSDDAESEKIRGEPGCLTLLQTLRNHC